MKYGSQTKREGVGSGVEAGGEAEAGVKMRFLDRALWQYSDEHQGKTDQ
jgi:hypothetical protein